MLSKHQWPMEAVTSGAVLSCLASGHWHWILWVLWVGGVWPPRIHFFLQSLQGLLRFRSREFLWHGWTHMYQVVSHGSQDPGEQGIVMRWSMLLTSPVSGFNFVADQRMRNSHCLTGHQGLNPDVYSSSLLLYVPSVQHQESRRVPSSSLGRLPKCSSMR